MEGKTKKVCKKIILYMLLIALAILWIVPMFTLLATAVKSKADFYTGVSLFEFPENPAWGNFVNAFKKGKLFMYMMRHRTGVFVFFLVGMMLPLQTALVPINVIYSKLGLLNTYFGLFYVYIGFGISFGILILRGFFRGIPREMDEAAYIDGCSKWQLFYRIILPVAKPAVATLVITDFLATWNEYLLGSVIINDNTMKTVPVGLMTFVGEHGTDYGYLCAGVLISLIPVLTVYLIFQRYFVEGMAGAVKM